MGSCPAHNTDPCRKFAAEYNCVVFNPKYTLVTQGKIDNLCGDAYACLKYIIANADRFGINPNKIVVHGNSGGGYVTLVLCNYLAQNNEGHLLRLAVADQFNSPEWWIDREKRAEAGEKIEWETIQVKANGAFMPVIAE